MSELRIFSYLSNPRIWKATIAARLCGIDVEVRGISLSVSLHPGFGTWSAKKKD